MDAQRTGSVCSAFQLDDVGVLDVGNLEGVAYLRSRDVYLPRLQPLLCHCGDLFDFSR